MVLAAPVVGAESVVALVETAVAGSDLPAVKEVALQGPHSMRMKDNDSDYRLFISVGFVSLVGSPQKVSVKIIRDTGASESFILASTLSFCQESSVGSSVLIRGIGMQTLSVPLHKIELHSELVKGVINIAVRPSLPVEDINVILGNNLAGGWVWSDVPPPLVSSEALLSVETDSMVRGFPEVFTTCAVTRAMSSCA